MTSDTQEAAGRKTLEIDSWRNLSKDNALRFAAMMPDTDTEVAVRDHREVPGVQK